MPQGCRHKIHLQTTIVLRTHLALPVAFSNDHARQNQLELGINIATGFSQKIMGQSWVAGEVCASSIMIVCQAGLPSRKPTRQHIFSMIPSFKCRFTFAAISLASDIIFLRPARAPRISGLLRAPAWLACTSRCCLRSCVVAVDGPVYQWCFPMQRGQLSSAVEKLSASQLVSLVGLNGLAMLRHCGKTNPRRRTATFRRTAGHRCRLPSIFLEG